MPFVLVVLLLAVLTSYLRGGRLRWAGEAPLRSSWLLFAGLGVQALVALLSRGEVLDVGPTLPWVASVVSQLLLVVFVVVNRGWPGIALVGSGLLLNTLVIAVNGGMPVDPEAIRALGHEPPTALPAGRHVLMTETTRLPWLADVLPFRPLRSIVSPGDLVLCAGLLRFVHALMRRPADTASTGPGAGAT